MMKFFYYLFFMILTGGFVACESTSRCKDRTEVQINVGFYTLIDTTETDTILSNPVIYGVGREDSVLTAGISSVKAVGLPPVPGAEGCTYIFEYGGTADTLKFTYSPELQFLSFECGFIEVYRNLTLETTHNIIDSSTVVETNVSNDEEQENVRIYIF